MGWDGLGGDGRDGDGRDGDRDGNRGDGVPGDDVHWDGIDGDGCSGDGGSLGSLDGNGRNRDKEVRDGDGHGGGPGTAAVGMGTAAKGMAAAGTGDGRDGETPQGHSINGKARRLRPGQRDESRTLPGWRGVSGRSQDSATTLECRLGGTAAAGGRSNGTTGHRPGGRTSSRQHNGVWWLAQGRVVGGRLRQ